MILKLHLIIGTALVASAVGTVVAAEQVAARHIYAVDGDTIDIGTQRFRLVGFDTPETYQARCSYEKTFEDLATNRVRQLVAGAGVVDVVVLPGCD